MAKVFGWLGKSRRQSALSKIILATQAWWDAWAIGDATVQDAEAADADPEAACFCFEARGRYAFRIDGDLVSALTGITGSDGGDLSSHVARSAMVDLARRLGEAGTSRLPPVTDASAVPEELADSCWGGCHFALVCGNLRLSLWLDRRAVDHWVPRVASQPAALVNRMEAAAPVMACLSASLDLGEISLEELNGLVPGDVIATSTPLTRPIDVATAPGQRHLFHGQLGERGGRRALRLLSPEVPESNP